jgi:uncharacterized protein YegP (UPF0339 family)
MMKKKSRLLTVLSLCLVSVMVLANCNGDGGSSPSGPGTVLLDKNVTVASGGGSAEVRFSASNGQTIRITLTATSNMEPYGYLTYPNGTGEYYPDLQTAQNGVNSIELTLNQTGAYELTIMDGSNQGGAVHVKVEVLSSALLDSDVTIPGGGGSAEVSFSASNGQTIRITLTAASNMEPYGYLTYPNGTEEYSPDLQTAQNGVNSVDLALNQTGTYRLAIMDGSNRGGTVHVKVEVL